MQRRGPIRVGRAGELWQYSLRGQKRGKGPVRVGSTQLGGPALPELWQYSEATLSELRGLQATVDGGEQEMREEDTWLGLGLGLGLGLVLVLGLGLGSAVQRLDHQRRRRRT